jgi:hypothetical protein
MNAKHFEGLLTTKLKLLLLNSLRVGRPARQLVCGFGQILIAALDH